MHVIGLHWTKREQQVRDCQSLMACMFIEGIRMHPQPALQAYV